MHYMVLVARLGIKGRVCGSDRTVHMLPQVRQHASASCNVPSTVLSYLLAHTERGVKASDQSQKEKNRRGPKATPDFPIIDGVAETLAAWSSSVDTFIHSSFVYIP
jgi:hypothetical protein